MYFLQKLRLFILNVFMYCMHNKNKAGRHLLSLGTVSYYLYMIRLRSEKYVYKTASIICRQTPRILGGHSFEITEYVDCNENSWTCSPWKSFHMRGHKSFKKNIDKIICLTSVTDSMTKKPVGVFAFCTKFN